MDVPEKTAATDAQNTLNQPVSELSSSSSSGNDSPDSSHASRPDLAVCKVCKVCKSKFIVTKSNIFKIEEPVSTTLNVPQSESHKSLIATTNATGNEEESEKRVEISGRIAGLFVISNILSKYLWDLERNS